MSKLTWCFASKKFAEKAAVDLHAELDPGWSLATLCPPSMPKGTRLYCMLTSLRDIWTDSGSWRCLELESGERVDRTSRSSDQWKDGKVPETIGTAWVDVRYSCFFNDQY